MGPVIGLNSYHEMHSNIIDCEAIIQHHSIIIPEGKRAINKCLQICNQSTRKKYPLTTKIDFWELSIKELSIKCKFETRPTLMIDQQGKPMVALHNAIPVPRSQETRNLKAG
jgi:hypothetical protein